MCDIMGTFTLVGISLILVVVFTGRVVALGSTRGSILSRVVKVSIFWGSMVLTVLPGMVVIPEARIVVTSISWRPEMF